MQRSNMKKSHALILGAVLVGGLSLGSTGAQASVIDGVPPASQGGPVVKEDIAPGTPLIGPGAPAAEGAATRGTPQCGNSAYAPPGGPGVYGPVSQATCALLGYESYLANYSWSMAAATDTQACVEGAGWSPAGAETWYAISCGSGGNADVSWGNVAAYQKVKAYSISVISGGSLDWH